MQVKMCHNITNFSDIVSIQHKGKEIRKGYFLEQTVKYPHAYMYM